MELQETSLDIWKKKYQLKDTEGNNVDSSPQSTLERVCRALAVNEDDPDEQYDRFMWAVQHGAVPAGRILANAGAAEYKAGASLVNCVVLDTISDDMPGILTAVRNEGITLSAGCGVGMCFSTIRPRGAYVSGVGAYTSGAVSFMDIFSAVCFTVSSAGGRRGALMGTMDVRHPDIEEFIKAKREDGRLRQFNMSCLITDEFIHAVKNDMDWKLMFPVNINHKISDDDEYVHATWVVKDPYEYVQHKSLDGRLLCKVYRTIKAKELWDTIMRSTYDFSEPGFILTDQINRMNNLWWCEDIVSSNPCSEQPLPPNGACLLGSINLTAMVDDPFTSKAAFNWERYEKVVSIFSRMLDNVVELNGLPLDEQQKEMYRKRRHGMGYTGLGSALTMLRVTYGTALAADITNEITYKLALYSYEAGVDLALEKGPAPIMNEMFTVTKKMLSLKPSLSHAGYSEGDGVAGKQLLARHSDYMAQFDGELCSKISDYGCRYTHAVSLAPTGSISLSMCNNVSNGIEPSFSHEYLRNVIVEGKKTKEQVSVTSYELLLYRELIDPDVAVDELPDYFVTGDSINPKQHIDMQAAAQEWVDSAISKTISCATDIPYDEFKEIYMYGYESKLAGLTTFRFNPDVFQGVLVKEEDLNNTTYEFTLKDGSIVTATGNERIMYDGEEHVAANLFDSIKENTFGRY